MKTLKLTKQTSGYYNNIIDNIEVIVSKCSGGWEALIIDYNKQGNEELFHTYTKTKKEAIKHTVNFILNENIN